MQEPAETTEAQQPTSREDSSTVEWSSMWVMEDGWPHWVWNTKEAMDGYAQGQLGLT